MPSAFLVFPFFLCLAALNSLYPLSHSSFPLCNAICVLILSAYLYPSSLKFYHYCMQCHLCSDISSLSLSKLRVLTSCEFISPFSSCSVLLFLFTPKFMLSFSFSYIPFLVFPCLLYFTQCHLSLSKSIRFPIQVFLTFASFTILPTVPSRCLKVNQFFHSSFYSHYQSNPKLLSSHLVPISPSP